ncbi:MAG: cyclic nucleotide-binding domain-containing protein [Pseudomonadota bacterium]
MEPESIFSAALLIHFGALLYIIGFLVRDELILRLLVLGGTILYIFYYLLFPDRPLWDAIITSVILGAANLWVLFRIVFERTTLAMTDDEKDLYEVFSTLNPGQFRQIAKCATWHEVDQRKTLCLENQSAEHLYYLMSGNAMVEKGDKQFPIGSGNFLGEIAFILDGEYTATVFAEPDMKYVEWNNLELKKRMSKNAALNNALIALFNHDLARKLAASHQ